MFALIIGLRLGQTMPKESLKSITNEDNQKKGNDSKNPKDRKERPKFYFDEYNEETSDGNSEDTIWSKSSASNDRSSQKSRQYNNQNKSSDMESGGEQDSSGDELLGNYRKYSSDMFQKLKSYEIPTESEGKSKDIKTKTSIRVKPKTDDFVDIDLMTI